MYCHHTNPHRRDDVRYMQKKQVTLRKQGNIQPAQEQEQDETHALCQKILAEARKLAELEIQKMALVVLSEATTVARWEQNPFYIT